MIDCSGFQVSGDHGCAIKDCDGFQRRWISNWYWRLPKIVDWVGASLASCQYMRWEYIYSLYDRLCGCLFKGCKRDVCSYVKLWETLLWEVWEESGPVCTPLFFSLMCLVFLLASKKGLVQEKDQSVVRQLHLLGIWFPFHLHTFNNSCRSRRIGAVFVPYDSQ